MDMAAAEVAWREQLRTGAEAAAAVLRAQHATALAAVQASGAREVATRAIMSFSLTPFLFIWRIPPGQEMDGQNGSAAAS
jgi:hypothetical protein